jgi:hypothetical protein
MRMTSFWLIICFCNNASHMIGTHSIHSVSLRNISFTASPFRVSGVLPTFYAQRPSQLLPAAPLTLPERI